MAALNFIQDTAIPATWTANSLYWIADASGTSATAYITDALAVPHDVGNATYITDIVTPLINAAISNTYNEIQIAATIAARDALTLTQNTMVVVTDASADVTVNAGAALYLWNNTLSSWSKLSEFESLDVTVVWGDITGGPASTPAQIDAAVAASGSVNWTTVTW